MTPFSVGTKATSEAMVNYFFTVMERGVFFGISPSEAAVDDPLKHLIKVQIGLIVATNKVK